MTSVNISKLRDNLYNYVDGVLNYGDNLEVRTKQGNIVMMSEEEYNGLTETLYLMSFPATAKEIKEGLETPLAECISEDEVNW